MQYVQSRLGFPGVGMVRALYENLTEGEKETIRTSARGWFTELLSVDGLEDEELAHLEGLMSLYPETPRHPIPPRTHCDDSSPYLTYNYKNCKHPSC